MTATLDCRGCAKEYAPHAAHCPHYLVPMGDKTDWMLTQTTPLVRFGLRILAWVYDWQHRKDGDAS